MLKKLFIIFLLAFSCSISYSQTVTWAISPSYDSLEEYVDGLYKIKEMRKVGLVSSSGKELVSASYDSITPFNEHIALALTYSNGKYIVGGIINEHNYTLTTVAGRYYITDKYPFFSEGKLVIYDSNNKYGYMQTDGSLFKSCQYLKTYPFYWGLACIHKGKNDIAYLKSDGSELITQLENEDYVLLSGTSFNEKGEAFVQGKAVGVKRCIINTKGRIVREAKFSGQKLKNYEYRKPYSPTVGQKNHSSLDGVNIFLKDGKYGFSDKNNAVILPAQFAEATPFRGGYAKVKMNGKYGILKLQSGTFGGGLMNNVIKVKNGSPEPVCFSASIPSVYFNKDLTLLVNGENISAKILKSATSGNEINYSFTPAPQNKEKEMIYNFSLLSEKVLLWESAQTITLEYVISRPIILSTPQISGDFKIDEDGYVRANSANQVDVYAIIENRSDETQDIIVTIGGGGVKNEVKSFSIASGNSVRISTCIDSIKERKQAEVIVETSTGLKQSKIIKVKPFI